MAETKTFEVGDVIDFSSPIGCMDMHIDTLWAQIVAGNIPHVWSWGVRNKIVDKKDKYGCCKIFRMRVSGHHHKGLVYIVLNWMDTYDLYFTTLDGKIKQKRENVYCDELHNILDEKIEKIDKYVR